MKQRYISKIIDKEGKMVDFERWQYKKVSTVEEKALSLFKTFSELGFYREHKVDNITIFDNEERIVKVIPL